MDDQKVRVQGVHIGPRLNMQPFAARNFRVSHTVQQPFHNRPAEVDHGDKQDDASQVHQQNRHRHEIHIFSGN